MERAGTQISLQQALDLAVGHHQAGRLREAETVYRQILGADPINSHALHLLGVLKSQVGQGDEAVDFIRQAISQNPTAAQYHCNLGAALSIAGKQEDAILAYSRALVLQPDLVDAHFNLGNAMVRQGRFDRAVDSLKTANELKPNDFKILDSLGSALSQAGRQEEAIDALRRALVLRADYAPTHHTLGNALVRSSRAKEAIEEYRSALALRPTYPEALCSLSGLLAEHGSTDEAIELARRALAIQETAAAWHNLGRALHRQNRLPEAEEALRSSVKCDGKLAAAFNELGNVLVERKRYPEAIEAFGKALAIRDSGEVRFNLGTALWENGNSQDALKEYKSAQKLGFSGAKLHNNIGAIHYQLGKFDEAEQAFGRAIAADAGFSLGRFNLGLVQLHRGNFREGWEGYEKRWEARSIAMPARYARNGVWDGGDLQGKRILLDCEQGFGDAIQFVRYVPVLAGRGATPMLATHVELRRLFKTVPCLGEIVCPPEELPSFDVQCPLLSLGRLLGTTVETIPNNVPYLAADAGLAERWRVRIPQDGRVRVGLCWSGNADQKENALRSPHLAAMEPLGAVEGAWFCSLQKGSAARQAETPPGKLRLVDWTAELGDFAETAALIANLDLVITGDTAVAHLAGAMGKTVWVLLAHVADWRWLSVRTDSPWYPTMRLFRQTAKGEWEGVVRRVVAELGKMVK